MAAVFIVALVAATSLGAYAVGARLLGLEPRALGGAARAALDAIGLAVVFLVLNLAGGLAVVLAFRALTPFFLSVYLLDDASLLALSALQGLVFALWRAGRRRGRA